MPMGKVLRISFLKIIVLFLGIGSITMPRSFGQVPVTDLQSFEISFTTGDSERDRSGIRLSMQEALRMTGLGDSQEQPLRFTSSADSQSGFFYVNAQGEDALGTYYHSSENNILAQISIRNATLNSISSVSAAFDFVYLSEQIRSSINFQLSYRVNGGEWISPRGGMFSSEYLQAESEGWNTFSMQIMLDQLYLLSNDNLELRWTAIGVNGLNEFIPLALQKTELFSTRAEPKEIRPGSLIISEIMPLFRTRSGSLEYVELYNSTEDPINLKGLILDAGNERVVIQKDLIVRPYSPVILAGHSEADRFDSLTDYRYENRLVSGNSGRLILSYEGTDLARALYETSDPGTAVHLNHLEDAYDGYSGLNNFVPATQEWDSGILGTPGRIEDNSLFFSKKITRVGWYLLNPPGSLSESLNRDLKASLFPLLDRGKASADDSAPYIYFHRTDSDAVRVYASGSKGVPSGAEKQSEDDSGTNGFQPVNFSNYRESTIGEIVKQNGQQAYPALLTWSASKQKFELIWQENDPVYPWSTYLISDQADPKTDEVIENDSNREKTWTGLNRSIKLSLLADSQSDTEEYDSVLLGFWDTPSNESHSDYMLPKIWTPLADGDVHDRDPMLYLKSANAGNLASSYLNFPYVPGELIQVSVGLKLPEAVERVQIKWDYLDTLPDQWEIEFIDADLGESVNMRTATSYSFYERSDIVSEGMNDPDRSFKSVEESDNSRFYIRISSTGDLGIFESENESAESIELKQNYPNPFNPTTTIAFYIPKATDVRIGVYNVVGQQVGQLVDERLGAGDHTVTWNAMDMPSGVYIVQLESSNSVQTRKITLIK